MSTATIPFGIAERARIATERVRPTFNKLQPVTILHLAAARPIVDIHDLVMRNNFALRTAFVSSCDDKLEDQVVIWYSGEAVAVPLETVLRDYRVLDMAVVKAGGAA